MLIHGSTGEARVITSAAAAAAAAGVLNASTLTDLSLGFKCIDLLRRSPEQDNVLLEASIRPFRRRPSLSAHLRSCQLSQQEDLLSVVSYTVWRPWFVLW